MRYEFFGLRNLGTAEHDPSGKVWAGAAGHHLYLVKLEGMQASVSSGGRSPIHWNPGERVLSWPQSPFWYPSTILAIQEERVSVAFDYDSMIEELKKKYGYANIPWNPREPQVGKGPQWLQIDQERPLEIEAGSRVNCCWFGDYDFYPATVAEKRGEGFVIHYDDADEDNVSYHQLRVFYRDSYLAELGKRTGS